MGKRKEIDDAEALSLGKNFHMYEDNEVLTPWEHGLLHRESLTRALRIYDTLYNAIRLNLFK